MKYIKITWYILILSFLFAGLYTGRREFFLLFFILLFVLLYSLALNLWTLLSFSYIQNLSLPSVVKGSAVYLMIGIHNDKPFPFTLMRILVNTVTGDENYELYFTLSPKSNIDFNIPVHSPYRGVYDVGMTKIETNDIFGLVKTRFDMRKLSYYKQQSIKITPKLVELPYLPARNTDAKYSGGAFLRLSEEGDSFSDLRRYRPGDPLKKIHKPISVKYRKLYVKNYDIPLETAILVAIDPAMDVGEGEGARYLADTACECVVAIAAISIQSGFAVEITGIDMSFSMKRGKHRELIPALCDTLAMLPFDKTGDLNRSLELAASGYDGYRAAYIISSSGSAPFSGALLRLQREGCRIYNVKVSHSKEQFDNDTPVAGIISIPVTPKDDIRAVFTGEMQ